MCSLLSGLLPFPLSSATRILTEAQSFPWTPNFGCVLPVLKLLVGAFLPCTTHPLMTLFPSRLLVADYPKISQHSRWCHSLPICLSSPSAHLQRLIRARPYSKWYTHARKKKSHGSWVFNIWGSHQNFYMFTSLPSLYHCLTPFSSLTLAPVQVVVAVSIP